ncbi:hypothetical protein HYH02_010018 [Chlamydomonas schloesseri]|uniref:Uncharacterized protein n=1 Tax=Chlamydomonas schloesseri TaxID=2026947 RepID=A0A835W6P2_9CHLO|nr:hypothetical protein HYH02_010018 [Chlamydomonas schloesseri]|eukprot:KAG2441430.1 hypothetical protein HYH02_010018 [Chlamydomonas schloesseri]
MASRRLEMISHVRAVGCAEYNDSASALLGDVALVSAVPLGRLEARANLSTSAESAESPASSCSARASAADLDGRQHALAADADSGPLTEPCGPAPLLRHLRTPCRSGRLSGVPPTWITAAAASLGNSPRFAASPRCGAADAGVSGSGLDACSCSDGVDRWSTPASTLSGIALLHQYHAQRHSHHHSSSQCSSCGSAASFASTSAPGSAAGSPFPPRSSLPCSTTNSSRFLAQSQAQQLRSVSFTAATAAPKAAAKGAAKAGSSSGAAGAPGGSSSGAASSSAAGAALRTPEWARVPGHLAELQDLYRKRQKRMTALRHAAQVELEAREAVAWKTGGRGRAAAAAAKAALEALPPPPPEDGGKAELAAAVASGTSFAAAHEALTDLLRRGVVLDADAHLAPLLRKAGDAAQLTSGLGLAVANHLAQAAQQLGAHGPRHGPLHAVLVQECMRLKAAAPLVTLWESLHEHGVAPVATDAAAAVRAAVALGDGGAAVRLLVLACMYGEAPLVGAAEAGAVLGLLQEGNPDQATQLRELLPKLGVRGA